MFGIFKKKPQRDKEVAKIAWTSKTTTIMKCIDENSPTDFRFCKDCDYTAMCNRIRKRMGV
jgi:hypothetical protein